MRGFGVCCLVGVATAAPSCASPQGWAPEDSIEGHDVGESAPSTDVAQAQQAVTSASWNTLGNTVTGTSGSAILGPTNTTAGDGPYPLELWVKPSGVAAVRALKIDSANPPNIIGGYSSNGVTSGVTSSVIGGGGDGFYGSNQVTDQGGVVNGGSGNQAGDALGTTSDAAFATAGGGALNKAKATIATVSGGYNNSASAYAGTIAGGYGNLVNTVNGGTYATVGGGRENVANGDYATVPGGYGNWALSDYSFAAGKGAAVGTAKDGSFVWSDSSGSGSQDLLSSGPNTFNARASGGYFLYSSTGTSAGVQLTAGSSAWAAVSDREKKKDFVPVNAQDVLRRVAAMPLSTWTYKSEPGVRHMGPMAQDFRAAFGLGTDDKTIVTIDADGVALAAAQGLNEKVTKLERENQDLVKRLERLEGSRSYRAGLIPEGPWSLAALGLGLGSVLVMRARRSSPKRP